MTQWRTQGFWSKARIYAVLALIAVFSFYSDATWLGDGSSNRKRVFSPGFLTLCVLVAIFELVVLNGLYGVHD
ncbi:hypothetical protein LOY35_18830 [Pseudomonas sp. B21-028]|jgi:hypothetical protein|uniref:hypothetical protein n=1 Tax=Pseudomonas sp. B21-028 TaxID=2895480 RepID=UPI00216029DF|nr:hypothetical protein [Pseudomonas sp. B21-028]UVL82275.1 hypothetical protein LOY35_18830 [Pseudomonas sp. B21-028]